MPTIGYRDGATGAATTARLSKNWFITQASGTTTQRLRLEYTDWEGKTQNAWLLGTPTAGYKFVTFSRGASNTLDPETCIGDGTCGAGDALEYLGSDGKNYSAKVRGPSVATGEAKFSPIKPAEGSPQSFSANGFSFTDAVGPLTYQWRFQNGGCNFGTGGCMGPDPTAPFNSFLPTGPRLGRVNHAFVDTGRHIPGRAHGNRLPWHQGQQSLPRDG